MQLAFRSRWIGHSGGRVIEEAGMICWRGWSEAKAKAAAAAILIWCQQRRKYPISKNYNNKSLLGSENRMVVWKDWENGNGFEGSIGNGIATRMEIYLQGVVGVVGWREILLLKISDFFHLKKKKKIRLFYALKTYHHFPLMSWTF